jgi:hypothetical protein
LPRIWRVQAGVSKLSFEIYLNSFPANWKLVKIYNAATIKATPFLGRTNGSAVRYAMSGILIVKSNPS